MPRRGPVKKRKVACDPLYNSEVVSRLINRTMRSGKKTVARREVYRALESLSKNQEEKLTLFNQALENIKPQMEVRPRRIGGAAYQVPMPVKPGRRQTLAIRWLIQTAQARSSKEHHTFAEKLSAEIKDAAAGTGGAVKKRQDMERMAEANKAFAHFRW